MSPAVRRVFDLAVEGRTEKEIAKWLELSLNTVHNHLCEVYRLCHVHSRLELLSKFIRRISLVLAATSSYLPRDYYMGRQLPLNVYVWPPKLSERSLTIVQGRKRTTPFF